MKTLTVSKRPAEQRGRADHGWLQARFTFSFSGYFDPDHMGFHALRVINNDTIQPGGGFPTHSHASMEIFTYVVQGELEHRDALGNGAVIKAGDFQYMSAGNGIAHSEFNPSKSEKTELYQIWLTPKAAGGEPRYAEYPQAAQIEPDSLKLLFSGDGRDGSTAIRQDADIYFGNLQAGKTRAVPSSSLSPHAWIQVVSGELSVLGETLRKADGLAIENAEAGFEIRASQDSTFILFRLA